MNAANKTAIIWSDRYREHQTGMHPESPARIDAIAGALHAAGYFDDRLVLAPEPATRETILSVHTPTHVDLIAEAARSGGGYLDPDTFVSAASWDIALLAVGGACQAVDVVMDGRAPRAFAFVRPPGHHAEPNEAMGFCLFNNVAIAARHALEHWGIERVAIVDWDVHHGNGTQAAFWREPRVLYISLHQYPLYPGTGARSEVGAGDAAGTILNIPLPPGSDDTAYQAAFQGLVLPRLQAFQPQLILVSAGYDAHIDDPLAMMRVHTASYEVFATLLRTAAEELCGGRLALVLEGGYNLTALGESVIATLRGLDA